MTPGFDKAIVAATFIGRVTQLGAFDHWLAQVNTGQSQVICVAGEAGIGKSRLVAEVRTRAEAQGWQTVQGACFEPDGFLPYAPLIDLLRTHLAHCSRQEVQSVLGIWAAEFVKLLPELALRLPGLPPTPRLDPEAEKRRLFDAFVYIFMGLLEGQSGNAPMTPHPLLLIIEDLHWCDDTSLEFLRYLVRRLAKRPLLLLCTYRSDEIHPALHHFLAALDREQRPVELRLPPFTPSEVDALVRTIFALQRPVRRAFLDTLCNLTEGNPFFIEEVLKALVTTGDIFYADGQWDRKALTDLQIPRTVQDAVQRRTARLHPSTRQVLNLAAVAGRRFDFALLQAATGHDEATLLAHIKELLAAQLLIEATPDHFAFRHALTQQAIYADLLTRERKTLHRTIGETIERINGPIAQPATNAVETTPWAALAYHFYLGEVWDKALLYAQRAGEQAQILHAPHAAVEHFTHALIAVQHLTASTPEQPDTAVVMRLHSARGLAHETLGDFTAARTDLETALLLAEGAGDRQAQWQALLALGELWASRDYGATRDYVQQALTLAQSLNQPDILARSLNRMGNWHLNAEEYSTAIRYHQEALAICQAANDEPGLAATFDLLGATYLLFGDLVQAVIHLEQAAARFRHLGDRRSLASTLAVLAARNELYSVQYVALPARNVAESIREAEEALQFAQEISWRSGEAHALIILSRDVVITGDFRRALALAQQGYVVASESEHRQWCCQAHFSLGWVALDLLAFAAAQHHFTQAVQRAYESNSVYLLRVANGLLALSYLHLHDLSKVEDMLNAAGVDSSPEGLSGQLIWIIRAELALARGNAALALHLADRLSAALPNIQVVGARGVPGLALLRGKALAALDRPAEAEDALQTAHEGAVAGGVPSLLIPLANSDRPIVGAVCNRTAPRETCGCGGPLGAHLRIRQRYPLLWRTQMALGHFYSAQGKQTVADQAFAAARTIIDELAAQIPDEPSDLVDGGSLRAHFLAQTSALFPPQPRLTPRQATKRAVDGLTAREVDVTIQIAQGKANREVAVALVVSERTVETHVGNILAKLGFSSRHQIAAWAMEKGLVNVNGAKP